MTVTQSSGTPPTDTFPPGPDTRPGIGIGFLLLWVASVARAATARCEYRACSGNWEGSSRVVRAWRLAECLCKAGGPSNFAARRSALRARVVCSQRNKIGSSAAAARCRRKRGGSPDRRPANRRTSSVLDDGDVRLEAQMIMVQNVGTASDRVMAALVAGLEIEFGRGAGEALTHRFLDAEEVDFRWDARTSERWLGGYQNAEEDDFALDRVAICGRLDGTWFVATMIVDGDGQAHGMLGCRACASKRAAREALATAH